MTEQGERNPPVIVTTRDLYIELSKLDAKMNKIIEPNSNYRVECDGRFSRLETKTALVYLILSGIAITVVGVIIQQVIF